MAGKLRIKVSVENIDSFWMFVDIKESRLIFDIQKKIEQRLENVNVASLLLDGCLLPANETSELLRDNDMVHVSVTKCGWSPSSQNKKHRKRKHSERDDKWAVTQNEADHDLQTPDAKKKKKIMKEKCDSYGHKSQKGNDNNHKSTTEPCVPDSELAAQENSGQKVQKETKKRNKKTSEDKCLDSELAGNDESGLAALGQLPLVHEMKTNEAQMILETLETLSGMTKNTAVDEENNSSVHKKHKRRRRNKKRANKDQPKSAEDSVQTLTVSKQTHVELRLPIWQKGQNKKTVFTSESADESASENLISSQESADKSQNVSLSCPGASDYNTSFSECYPETSTLNLHKGSNAKNAKKIVKKHGAGDAVTSDARGTQQDSTLHSSNESKSDLNIDKDWNGTTAEELCVESQNFAAEENRGGACHRNKRDVRKEKNTRQRSSASDRMHCYTSNGDDNLAESLKMSPEERGSIVSPYVTARRLSNGAMLYTRFPITDWNTASSLFRSPSAQTPQAPRTPSKQQQLQTVNTNRSIIIENSNAAPSVSTGATESEGKRNGERPASMSRAGDSTPLPQDYLSFPDLTSTPEVGDHIAYKVLEMGEDYTPGISDFKEAEVLMYDPSTQNVTVRLLHPDTKKRAYGKFDIHEDITAAEEVTLELSSMFEPKLIPSH